MDNTYQPTILAFLCNWCAYAGADLAGVSRLQYPPTFRVIRTMCSGRVDPLFVLKGLTEGYDGVFIGGCHPGDCHYQDGNLYTIKRVEMLQILLDLAGIGRNRIHLQWASAAEAQTYAESVRTFSTTISQLGPFDPSAFQLELAGCTRAVSSQRLRWLVGIDRQVTERSNVYGVQIDPELFQRTLQEAVTAEYQKGLIQEVLCQSPASVPTLSERTRLDVYTVSQRLNELERIGLAELAGHEGHTPIFRQ